MDQSDGSRRTVEGNALDAVRSLLAPHAADPVAGLPPFQGGAAGYLAYDWGAFSSGCQRRALTTSAWTMWCLACADWVLAWDHEQSQAWLISTGVPETSAPARTRRAEKRAAFVRERLAMLSERKLVAQGGGPASLQHRATLEPAPSYPVENGWWDSRLELRSSFTRKSYLDAVARVREYVFAGDIFQSNLSQRFEAPLGEPPWALYRRLRAQKRGPVLCALDYHPESVVLSASPERFLRVDVEGHVETRPIKGTRPRGLGPEHDAALGVVLTESAKDRAENLMIVDLMRNDLSRVCSPGTACVGTVRSGALRDVHHLVSTVVGQLAPGRDALDLLRGLSWRLDHGRAQTAGDGDHCRTRTLTARSVLWFRWVLRPHRRARHEHCHSDGARFRDRVYFSAGGGIVADSDPQQEYLETLDKARGLIDALAPPS